MRWFSDMQMSGGGEGFELRGSKIDERESFEIAGLGDELLKG